MTPAVELDRIPPYATAAAEFAVALDDSVTSVEAGDFHIEIDAAGACEPVVGAEFAMLLNADVVSASSAEDPFDAPVSVWTPAGDAARWQHVHRTVLDGMWAGADADVTSDASLESPPLVAGQGRLSVTVTHRYAFEFSSTAPGFPPQAFDGGVIEYSTDGGATWLDLSGIAVPGYNHTITAGTSSNPLAGRPAYGSTSPGYPMTSVATLDFGTRLAGRTFALRFRIGTDRDTGAPGWEIERVAFTGLSGTPFPSLVADTGTCGGGTDAGAPDGSVTVDAVTVDAAPVDAAAPSDAAAGSSDAGTAANAGGGGCASGGSGPGGLAMVLVWLVVRRRGAMHSMWSRLVSERSSAWSSSRSSV